MTEACQDIIPPMHTYSHAIFTWAIARYLKKEKFHAAAKWGAAGAALPDVPTFVKAARFLWRRRDSMYEDGFKEDFLEALEYFQEPAGKVDLALHSLAPVGFALTLYKVLGVEEKDPNRALLAFLLGWAGHNVVDFPTHSSDARPPFWPLFGWRWKSPISYWDRKFYALPFIIVEHAAILALAAALIYESYDAPLE